MSAEKEGEVPEYPCNMDGREEEEDEVLEGGGPTSTSSGLPPFPPTVVTTGLPPKMKEVVLISLALLLLACSILLFFKHWKKNYRDINQLPYYSYLYHKDEEEFRYTYGTFRLERGRHFVTTC